MIIDERQFPRLMHTAVVLPSDGIIRIQSSKLAPVCQRLVKTLASLRKHPLQRDEAAIVGITLTQVSQQQLGLIVSAENDQCISVSLKPFEIHIRGVDNLLP